MRVRISGHEGTAKLGQSDFTVLAIQYSEADGLMFTVEEEGNYSGTPFLVKAAKCTVIDGRVPSTWRAAKGEEGAFDLAPPEWLENGFWDAYYDRKPEAVATYQKAKATIEAESRGT